MVNIIADNLYSQADSEGYRFLVLEEISNQPIDLEAITVVDGFIISQGGNKHPKKTTRGWELLTQTKEGF